MPAGLEGWPNFGVGGCVVANDRGGSGGVPSWPGGGGSTIQIIAHIYLIIRIMNIQRKVLVYDANCQKI